MMNQSERASPEEVANESAFITVWAGDNRPKPEGGREGTEPHRNPLTEKELGLEE